MCVPLGVFLLPDARGCALRWVYSAWRCGPLVAAYGAGRLVVNEELNEIRLFSMFGAACVNLNMFRLWFPLGVSFLPKAAPRAGFPATGAADPCSRPTAQDDS